jgi:polyisoprenoid-binding protein YceI
MAIATATPTLLPPETWRIDLSTATVEFAIRHFGVATVRGTMRVGALDVGTADDGLRIDGAIDPATVETGNLVRDDRLRSELFATDEHPAITFSGREADGRVTGALTIRGVSRPIELDLRAEPQDDGTVRLRATGELSRREFGLGWAELGEAGRLLADRVRVSADVLALDG